MGLPVIGSTKGATPELVRHGVNGFLLPPENFIILSNIINDLYTNQDKRVHMSLAAKQAYNKNPTWSDSLQSIEDFLQEFV